MGAAPQIEEVIHRPHPGPQTDYFSIDADILIYGGSAGGGKTWCLLADPLRWIHVPGFNAVILRRDSEQIRQAGGLWDASLEIYRLVGGQEREHTLDWRFGTQRIRFDSMLRENDKLSYQGAEIAYLAFDELTHFSQSQFWYLQSRNRSKCGIRPYTRGTCNPDPNSWVFEFLGPWVDDEFHQDGERFSAKSGEVLWFVRDERNDSLTYYREHPGIKGAKSLCFVRASLQDNPTLLEKDPGYLETLMAMPLVDRERLLHGNWAIAEGGNFFKPEWFEILEKEPDIVKKLRFWDLAASKPKPGFEDPDYTVGILIGKTRFNRFGILDVKRLRGTPGEVEQLVADTAIEDGIDVPIRMEQEGGASGKTVIDHYARNILAGFDFSGNPPKGDKPTRAKPLASQAEAGNVFLLKAQWNKSYLNELAVFPNPKIHDDQVDASSGAYRELCMMAGGAAAKIPKKKGKYF